MVPEVTLSFQLFPVASSVSVTVLFGATMVGLAGAFGMSYLKDRKENFMVAGGEKLAR
jgi:hypothetical protein